MKHLIFLFAAFMFYSLTVKAQSTSDTIVVNCQGSHNIIPYGRSKIFTITDGKLNGKMITFSYKLENTMTEKPWLFIYYTEGNIDCLSVSYYYYSKETEEFAYTMTENKINFTPSPYMKGLGDVLVRVFLVLENDKQPPYKAVSNVGSMRMLIE